MKPKALTTIAALYVDPKGCYAGLPGVDLWDEARDARTYSGPHRVVAHPPCARWCQLAKFVEHQHPDKRVGEDDGCFRFALEAVRQWGGVLEHPAWSLAWPAFGLPRPSRGGWVESMWHPGEWVTEVSQVAYGHAARKRTWLLYVGGPPPEPMRWSEPTPAAVVASCSRRHGSWLRRNQEHQRDGSSRATPPAFRDALLAMAST